MITGRKEAVDETRSHGAVAVKVTKDQGSEGGEFRGDREISRDCSLKLGLRTFIACISVFYHRRI